LRFCCFAACFIAPPHVLPEPRRGHRIGLNEYFDRA
jgi:hypothetical protein